jgi:hypothetical protein
MFDRQVLRIVEVDGVVDVAVAVQLVVADRPASRVLEGIDGHGVGL